MSCVSGVEIGVGKMKLIDTGFCQEVFVVIQRVVHAGDIEVFGLLRGNLEVEGLERSHLGYESQKKSQHAGAETWASVAFAPLLLVVSSRKVVAKLASVSIWSFLDHLLLPSQQRDPGHLGHDIADGAAEGADRQVLIGDYVAERNAVGIEE